MNPKYPHFKSKGAMTVMKQLITTLTDPILRKKPLLLITGTLIIGGWIAGSVFEASAIFDLMMITSALVAGYDIVQRAWQGLKNRHTNIELLVSIAAAGGIAIGIHWEAAAVTFLFLLGGWLESRSLGQTRDTLKNLINLAPDKAIVLDEAGEREIPARQVEENMLISVKPGGRIPVDATVESGRSNVDESMITGEPLPAEKQSGATVFAGTINQNGYLRIRATQVGADTTLARIVRRVEEAQEEKAPTQRFIERFASWYTPGIVGLSVLTLLYSQNLELALTLLVIGCPGALVISTPISIISGIGRAARNGILIKGGEYLEDAGSITAVALDKTGTLTEGTPGVTDIVSFHSAPVPAGSDQVAQTEAGHHLINSGDDESLPEELQEILQWAGIGESVSEHPLGQAILERARSFGEIPEPDSFESHTGRGIEASYGTDRIRVGSAGYLREQGIPVEAEADAKISELAGAGRTVVLVAVNDELIGLIGIADRIRTEAADMISRLRQNGIQRIVMLTGDAPETARSVARQVGIREVDVYARILPEEKTDVIRSLQQEGEKVAMVGDGINDAPALAAADIGIAMGAAGTDVAMETADIALMTDDLAKIPEALRISRLTLRNIYQNVALAMVTVAALLTGVFMGEVHMAGGMLIHELSVMLVIVNGMRLRWR